MHSGTKQTVEMASFRPRQLSGQETPGQQTFNPIEMVEQSDTNLVFVSNEPKHQATPAPPIEIADPN